VPRTRSAQWRGHYIAKNRRDGLAEATVGKREWFLRLVERRLGQRPVAEIAPFEILEAVRPYEAAKNDEKAHRTLQFVGQVFRYAIANQLAASDPTRDLRGALASRKPKHLGAILESRKAGELLRAIDGYQGSPSPGLPCSFPRCCLCVPASCAGPNGQRST
jgi:integrase